MSNRIAYHAQPVQPTEDDLRVYDEEVIGFEADDLAAAQRSASRRGVIGAGFAALSGLFGVGLYQMSRDIARLSRQQNVRAVSFDKTTGESYQIKERVGPPEGGVEVAIRHLAWQYMRARENYSRAEDADNFLIVTSMSTAEEQRRFKLWWEREPDGPRQSVKSDGVARIATRAEPQLFRSGPKGAYDRIEYRFTRSVFRPNQDREDTKMLSTLFFGWDEDAIRADDRMINPFGFVVGDYRRGKETV